MGVVGLRKPDRDVEPRTDLPGIIDEDQDVLDAHVSSSRTSERGPSTAMLTLPGPGRAR